jgi:phosphate starvation-inducible PhoH-like protein
MPSDAEHVNETIHVENTERLRGLLGRQDRNLRMVRDACNVRAAVRGNEIILQGEAVSVRLAGLVIRDLLSSIVDSRPIPTGDIDDVIDRHRAMENGVEDVRIDVFLPGRAIRPRTPGQAGYLRAIAENDLVLCTGPAGSGKTYLAVAMAVAALKRDAVRKIVLTRPAVEAGERLGFLPGGFEEKVDPYLRPLYDALHDMMSFDQLRRYMESDVVEVVPLAYMRGRTLDRAFIILDEGQNCTRKQMQMFLTRLGAASKSVVTGDVSQTDLPGNEISGMVEATTLLRGTRGIGFATLTQRDIIRHRLVQDIVDAYEARDRRTKPSAG